MNFILNITVGCLRRKRKPSGGIRKTEELLLNAEKFSAISTRFGKAYPSTTLTAVGRIYCSTIFTTFFPGSGIAVNYLDAKRNLEDVGRVGEKILDASLERDRGER